MTANTTIVPEVNRNVHFIPAGNDVASMMRIGSQPLHAVVIYVHNERMVNLSIIDHQGQRHVRTSVELVQPGDETPSRSHCRWVDYQVKAAATPAGAADTADATKSDGAISPVVAGVLATSAAALTGEDLAGVSGTRDQA